MMSFSIDLDEAVLNQFSRFCALAEEDREGQEAITAIIPSLYANARSASPCIPAILAMAWLRAAPFATGNQRIGAARRKYGEAVLKLREALQDPHTAKADDALFTVLFMLVIEVKKPLRMLVISLVLVDVVADFWDTEHDRHFRVNAKSNQAHIRCRYVN